MSTRLFTIPTSTVARAQHNLLESAELRNAWKTGELSCVFSASENLPRRLAHELSKEEDNFVNQRGDVSARAVRLYCDSNLNTADDVKKMYDKISTYREEWERLARKRHSAEFRAGLINKATKDYKAFKTAHANDAPLVGYADIEGRLEEFKRAYPKLPKFSCRTIVDLNVDLRMLGHTLNKLKQRIRKVSVLKEEARKEEQPRETRESACGTCVVMSVAKAETLLAPSLSQRRMDIYQL